MDNASFASPTPQPLPPSPTGGWFSRNWKWAVPVGIFALFLLFVAFVFGLVALVFGGIKSSDAYKQALEKARTDPAVVASMGSPIQDSWYLTGSINVSGPTGDADLAIPIHGPKGKGTLYAVAKKSAGQWHFTTLQVEIEGTPGRIDLLQQVQ